MDSHHLHAGSMPTNFMHTDPRCNRRIPLVKNHAIFVNQSNHASNVIHFKCTTETLAAHEATRRKRHFIVLQVKLGNRKLIKRTYMIVMQMRDHDFGNVFGVDAQQLQRIGWSPQQCPVALIRHILIETRIHQHQALPITYHPKVIIHWHGHIVGVSPHEMVGSTTLSGRIL